MNTAMSRIKWLVFAAAVLLVIWAASPQVAPTPGPVAIAVAKPPAAPKYALQITPAEFFTGELKRLKPHVDFQAACFKIAKQGRVWCLADVQMWCDGVELESDKYVPLVAQDADEVTLSWRRKQEAGKTQYHVTVGGMTSFRRRLDEPRSKQKIEVAFGPILLRKPVTLKAAGDAAVVWAIGTGKGADLTMPEEVEKMMKTAPWVLLLKVTAMDRGD
jgi:hypothetical protein